MRRLFTALWVGNLSSAQLGSSCWASQVGAVGGWLGLRSSKSSTGLGVQDGSNPWLAANAGRGLGASELFPRAPVHGLRSPVTNQA